MFTKAHRIKKIALAGFLLGIFLLSGCNLFSATSTPSTDPGSVYTQSAQTVVAQLTQTAQVQEAGGAVYTQAAQTVIADLTQNAPTATFTSTPTSTSTSTPPPTFTPVTPSPTPRLIPCDAAKFIADVTIPDGTIFPPNARFTKIWRLQNVGTCTWNNQYSLVFVSGERMGAANVIQLNTTVVPGQAVDLAVEMIAPNQPGTYRSNWQLRNPQGQIFGIGNDYDNPFWAQIRVVQPQSDYAYDFVFSACEAQWDSATQTNLPCPGKANLDTGYMTFLDRPVLEDGRNENEPALLVVPNKRSDGYIVGHYRNIRIRDGYRFKSGIMCADLSNGCDVIFSLSYRLGSGQLVQLSSWREVYDGQFNVVSVDLSFLSGETIDLYLTVEANNSNKDNRAMWWVPRIEED